jgi:hypothetical protein
MDETEVGRIEAWVGLDVGKEDHHATVVSAAGERLFELAVRNDEAALARLLARALDSDRVRWLSISRARSGRWRSWSRAGAGCRSPTCRGW